MKNNKLHLEREADMQKRETEMVLKMAKRMSHLENQVKEVQERLSEALQTISDKDEQLEKLKAQVLKEGADEVEGMYDQPDQPKNQRLVSEREYYNGEFPPKQYPQQNEMKNARKLTEIVEERINKPENPNRGSRNVTEMESNELSISVPDDSIVYESQSSDNESLGEYADETSQEMLEFSRLTKQVSEMEKFLADYGLIWVGDANIRDGNSYRKVQASIGFSPNFDKIIMVISELNDVVSSESHMEVSKNRGKFKKAEVLKLALFADGIQLEDNPFREYSSESVQEFFRDLEDGYYPTELKDIYPDGVIFRVIDKRSTTFEEAQSGKVQAFSGEGHKLGSINDFTTERKRQIPPYPGPSGRKIESPPQIEVTKKKGKKIKSKEKPVEFNKRNDYSKGKSKEISKGLNNENSMGPPKPRMVTEENVKKGMDSKETVLAKQKEIQGPDSKAKFDQGESPPTGGSTIKPTQKSDRKLETFVAEENKNKVKSIVGEYMTESSDNETSRTLLFRDKIDITNITYNEAPITITQPQEHQPPANPNSSSQGSCNCPIADKSHPMPSVDHSIRPKLVPHKYYETSKINDTSEQPDQDGEYIYSKEIIHSADESSPSLSSSVPKMGLTEYRQQYDENVKNIIEAINKRSTPTKPPQINPNEEFEHFTFLGTQPKTDHLIPEGAEVPMDNPSTGNAINTETSAAYQQDIISDDGSTQKANSEEPEKKSIESFTEDEDSEETTGVVTFPNDSI